MWVGGWAMGGGMWDPVQEYDILVTCRKEKAILEYVKLVESSKNQLWYLLQPGEIAVMDNWRVSILLKRQCL